MITKILRSIDAFGQPVMLKLNGQTNHQTMFGGIASLSVLTFMIIFFYSQINSFIQNGDNTAIVTKEFKQSKTVLGKDFLETFAIGFDKLEDSQLFNITIIQNTYYNQVIYATNYLELEKCQLNEISLLSQKNIGHKLENYFCIKPNQNMTIGSNENESYEIQIEISQCLSSSHICQPDIQLNKQQSYKIQILFMNTIINPITSLLNNQFISQYIEDRYYIQFVPDTFIISEEIYFTKYDIYDDQNIIYFEDINESSVLQANFKNSKQLIQYEDKLYAKFTLKQDLIQYQIERNQGKITDLLAKLGGFLKIILFSLGVILSFYNSLQVYLDLANKIYEFSFQNIEKRQQQNTLLNQFYTALKQNNPILNNDDKIDKLQTSIQIIDQMKSQPVYTEFPNINDQIPVTTERNEIKEINQSDRQPFVLDNLIEHHTILAKRLNCKNSLEYFEKQINLIMNRSEKLKLSIILFLNQIFCQKLFTKNTNVILFQKAMKKISSRLDISFILEKLEEIDKLKQIVLTPSQLQIFNFSPKELIFQEQEEIIFNRYTLEQSARKHTPKKISIETSNHDIYTIKNQHRVYENIFKAYENIISQYEGRTIKEHKDINSELIGRMGPEISTLFKVSKMIDYKQLQLVRRKIMTRRNAVINEHIEITNLMKQFYE